jgi:hypothetical protein
MLVVKNIISRLVRTGNHKKKMGSNSKIKAKYKTAQNPECPMMQGNEKKCLRIEESNNATGRPLIERGGQEREDTRAHGNQTRGE